MLVLSRKVGEELVIGDNIRVVISRIAGNRVAVGIEAPDEVSIVRGELREIREEFALSEESAEADEGCSNEACSTAASHWSR